MNWSPISGIREGFSSPTRLETATAYHLAPRQKSIHYLSPCVLQSCPVCQIYKKYCSQNQANTFKAALMALLGTGNAMSVHRATPAKEIKHRDIGICPNSTLSCPGNDGCSYQSSVNNNTYIVNCELDFYGHDLENTKVTFQDHLTYSLLTPNQASSLQNCLDICAGTHYCAGVTFSQETCYMKQAVTEAVPA